MVVGHYYAFDICLDFLTFTSIFSLEVDVVRVGFHHRDDDDGSNGRCSDSG